jgi:hypothetical protein
MVVEVPHTLRLFIHSCYSVKVGFSPLDQHGSEHNEAVTAILRRICRTAIEMALYDLLLIENQPAPSALGNVLLAVAERWSLGTLLAAARRLPSLPASVTEDSVQLRNRVLHKTAHQPTEAESADILAAATDAVSAALPQDDMLQNAEGSQIP